MKYLISILLLSIAEFSWAANPLPVNIDLASAEVQEATASISRVFNKFIPIDSKDISDLALIFPNSDMFIYVLDAKTAGELGLTFLSAEAAKKTTIIIQEYSMYRPLTIDKNTERFGIGIRLFITVNEKSSKMGTLSIPALAAKAESSKLEATIRLQVIGISGEAITNATPMPSELNFSTLMEMYQKMNEIKGLIWKAGTKLTPQQLSFSGT